MKKVMLFAWLGVLAACLAGCADDNAKKMAQLRQFLEERPAPIAATEYRVLPPDVLSVTSLHVPEIHNQRQQVTPDGKINLPLLGEVFVANKTPREIEEAIMAAARQYYEQVDATVQVTAYNSEKIYVFGQVSRPGPQPWTGCDTLLDILAVTQPTTLAWPERIKLVRGGTPQRGGYEPEEWVQEALAATQPSAPTTQPVDLVDGRQVLTINLMDMVTKGDLSHNVLLQPRDVVYVPANPPAEVGLFLQNLLFPVRPVLEAVRVPSTVQGAFSGQ